MSKRSRTKIEQSKHDRVVRRLANELKDKGWCVRADVKGYPRPYTVGYKKPKRPDIYARKGSKEIIIEVETDSSIGTKRTFIQDQKFKRWKRAKPKTRQYRLILVD